MIIYKTTNTINGKFYVGKDTHNNPSYLGSGFILRKAIRKYSVKSFVKETIEVCETETELNLREVFWIEKLNPPYNIAAGGTGGSTMKHASEKKIRAWKRKISESGMGRKLSKESIEKMSLAKKGQMFTDKHKRNLSEAHIGNIPWNKGKKTPPEVIARVLPDVECPHCGKVGQRWAMGRWHFDNCRA